MTMSLSMPALNLNVKFCILSQILRIEICACQYCYLEISAELRRKLTPYSA